MPLHYRFYIAGIVFGILGMVLGIWMGMVEDFTFKGVHAHLNLVGWVTHFLYGIYYRAHPHAEARTLPHVQFWCAVIGMILFVPGIASAAVQGPVTMLIIPAALLTLAALLIFLVVVLQHARHPAARPV